jgi:type II secretion system protein G
MREHDVMRNAAQRQSGFTLIELLIVVAVIGIVAAISIISYFTALDKAKQRATMADMRSVSRALEAYIVDNNFAPDDSGGVNTLTGILIPYQINVVPVRDHWGTLYNFESNAFDSYTLESYGKDTLPGADISYNTRMDFNLDIVISDGVFKAAPE